jgi:hypothetical protein
MSYGCAEYHPTAAQLAAAHAHTVESLARAARERAARPGLVSVPTTHTGSLPRELVEANRKAATRELQSAVGAFEIDKAAKRYSGLRRAVGFAARAHAVSEKGSRTDQAWMVTLTFAGDNSDWKPEQLTRAMNAYRNWCVRQGFSSRYVWVAELQKRGVIHYHIAAWLPRGIRMPKWDACGWWHEGMTNTLKAKHATAYLMAYLKKGDLDARGSLPKGARNYGVGGLDHSLRRARRWLTLPAFVQGNSSIWDDWRRVKGGGWNSPDGEHVASEFASVFVAGVRCLVRVAQHATVIAAGGPFSWLSDRATALKAA